MENIMKNKGRHRDYCEYCGKGFTGVRKPKYCSTSCRVNAYHKRKRKREVETSRCVALRWFKSLLSRIASWFN